MVPQIKPSEVEAVAKRLLPECVDVEEVKAHVEFAEGQEFPQMHLFVKYKVKGFPGETSVLNSNCDYTESNDTVFKMITDFVWYTSRECRDKIMRRFLATDSVAADELLPEREQGEIH